jgi:hypothetical protein
MYGQMVLNSYGTNDNEVDVRAMLTDAGKNHVNHCECHCSPHYLLGRSAPYVCCTCAVKFELFIPVNLTACFQTLQVSGTMAPPALTSSLPSAGATRTTRRRSALAVCAIPIRPSSRPPVRAGLTTGLVLR